MKNLKVIKIDEHALHFENNVTLSSYHEPDCCESHYLGFNDLTLDDFKDLEFDLSNDNFFERIVGYGIALLPVKGFPIRIPGYGYNNGWYSSALDLVLVNGIGQSKLYGISDCQVIND